MEIKIKRVYLPAGAPDGLRILVDRLWPRGLSKVEAAIDYWAKDVSPSSVLRKQFHASSDWVKFRQDYLKELSDATDAIASLRQQMQEHQIVTLLYASHDELHNNAVVLREYLES